MDDKKYKAFIINNWKNESQLKTLIGKECDTSFSFHFGDTPTNSAVVVVKDGKITRVRTYSGLSWSPLYGYGAALIDVR